MYPLPWYQSEATNSAPDSENSSGKRFKRLCSATAFLQATPELHKLQYRNYISILSRVTIIRWSSGRALQRAELYPSDHQNHPHSGNASRLSGGTPSLVVFRYFR